MHANAIHCQPSMPIPEFHRDFGSEAQYIASIMATRWSQGYVCSRHRSGKHGEVQQGTQTLDQSSASRYQAFVTAGSLMDHNKLPMTTWFLAIYLISQPKTGLSPPTNKRQLRVRYPTAWLLHHKINYAMAQRGAQHRLSGDIKLGDAYIGGERVVKPDRGFFHMHHSGWNLISTFIQN